VKYTYGPVPSRRLGRSLGVDLVPTKICTYNCIYCQIHKTTRRTLERKEYVPAETILHDVHEALREVRGHVDYIACSGSGEPCLNSAIGEIIEGIKELTRIPVAVITNSSLLHLKEVRQALLKADVIMPSLDAASPAVFQVINRPHPSLEIREIIEGLAAFRGEYKGQLWLEILLCQGVNDGQAEIEGLREAIHIIRPDLVQLNTVVRPAVEAYAAALTIDQLEQVRSALGADVEIIADFEGHRHLTPLEDLEEKVIRIIERRPETPEDLAKALGLNTIEMKRIADKLTKQGRIKYRLFNERLYYEIDKGEADKRA
jgi:wyosine [tRNA(Phe)-imidazoG37] synthetase (radical SAM superfamily)